MKDNLFARRKACDALFILCVSCPCLFGQGQLPPPPGTPGPTMKSLDQIDAHVAQVGETRIPIDSAHTPGDVDTLFHIDKPGSYYLTANITGVSGKNGIFINADNVTVDLNGFALIGVSGSGHGILAFSYVRIHNGSVRNWGSSGITAKGLYTQFDHLSVSGNSGPGLSSGFLSVLSDITADGNSIGIHAGGTLTRCIAAENTSVGIQSTNYSILTSCAAHLNNDGGIECGTSCTITGCAAYSNGQNGINAGDGSTISKCTVRENKDDGIYAGANCHISDCTADINGSAPTGSGIETDIRASITGCTAIGNKADGIVFSGDSFVLNNHASKNGGAGFHDVGSASRIDGNVSRENTGTGILAATGDTVVRNNSGANGNGAADNQYGPTVGANWGPVGTANSATSPWANF